MNHQIFNREILTRIIHSDDYSVNVRYMALGYSLGKNLDEIASKFGVKRERVRQILAKNMERERMNLNVSE
jgi:DNA-directed RNA polymerase sigma subunit (sigma70/sigma32)